MTLFSDKDCDPEQLSPLALAFVGDTVFDLFVREKLIKEANRPVSDLHAEAAKTVNAGSQAAFFDRLESVLDEKEKTVMRRGRNAHTRHRPKGASSADYHKATGLECLFGYLYLSGRDERLRELFLFITGEEE